jgi:DNA transformation protein and related proteins
MKTDLSNVINIGKDTEKKLKLVGIDSYEELKAVGSEQAFLRLQTIDPGACLSLLCALEGAVQGVRWHALPYERKEELKLFLKMTKREIKH